MIRRRYIMLGAPVTTVRTPPLLAAWLRSRGVDAEVRTHHVDPVDLPAFMDDVSADRTVDGLLVTMPHKQAMTRYVRRLDTSAAVAGSVNAVKRIADGSLSGAQFDGRGLVSALREAGVPLRCCRVWLKGVGGAGRSIAAAVLEHGCAHLLLDDTGGERPGAALSRLIEDSACPASWVGTGDPGERDLLVNATPLGMSPRDRSPFSRRAVAASRYVADIVADPPSTRLARWAAEAGPRLITGRDMVEGQVELIGDWLLAER